jgi:hypothetical protein
MSTKVDQSSVNSLKDDERNFSSKIEFKKELNELSIQSKRNAKLLILFFLIGISIMIYIIYSFPSLEVFKFYLSVEKKNRNLLSFPEHQKI